MRSAIFCDGLAPDLEAMIEMETTTKIAHEEIG